MSTPLVAPSTIDPTGTTDVSDALLNFCDRAGGGKPWRHLQLQPDARYWCERGFVIPHLNFSDLDLNGAQIFAKGTGSTVRPHDDDYQVWPRRRCIVRLKDSWAGRVFSSRTGAKIDGGHTTPDFSLGWPVGRTYDKRYEGQHGFAFDHCRECTFDLRSPDRLRHNIEVTNVRGDLICHLNYSSFCTAIGLGLENADAKKLVWSEANGGPGLHHSGRQGLNVNSGCWGAKFRGLPVWQAGRAWLDMEPGGGGTVHDTLVEDCLVGSFRGFWISSVGNGYVNDFVARRVRANRARPLKVICDDSPQPWQGPPRRRSNWTFDDIDSEAPGSPPLPLLRFVMVDGVKVTNFHHRISGHTLDRAIETTDCTNVVTEPSRFEYV